MKYINHMTSSVEDEKHETLIDRSGLAGYGAYWIVAEKIAAQIRPEAVSTSLSLSWRNWARHLRTSTQKTQFLLRSMSEARLVLLSEANGLVKVDMPNILKYCDEYSRKLRINSGQTPDKLRSESGLPALPALPDQQALPRAREAGGVLEAPPAPAPQPVNPENKCDIPECPARWVIKTAQGKFCRKCNVKVNDMGDAIPGMSKIGAIS